MPNFCFANNRAAGGAAGHASLGARRIIPDVGNGVVAQLARIHIRTLGRFDNPFGKRGTN
jgi:hypothetical protein